MKNVNQAQEAVDKVKDEEAKPSSKLVISLMKDAMKHLKKVRI